VAVDAEHEVCLGRAVGADLDPLRTLATAAARDRRGGDRAETGAAAEDDRDRAARRQRGDRLARGLRRGPLEPEVAGIG
jgi:hypothetical protein